MTNDTKNSLTDFDMCLALAQKAINSQMEAAWDTWIARSEFSNIDEMKDFALVSIFPLKKSGKPSKYGLEVEFAPLTVSLYVPSGKLGQVKVTLHLQSGTVTYFDEEEEEKSSYDFKDWSVSFLTDLDKQPCDLETLKRIDPNVGAAAQKVIEDSPLPDSVFSIEYLFMKFTQVDLLLSDNKDINIPSDVPDGARTKALTCLNKMLQGDTGEFMMGTVVRRSKTKSKGSLPTFALTDFIFNVKAGKTPEASTLSYLGMFSRRSLPSDIDAARLKLKDSWVRPEMLDGTKGLVSGTMAISKERFVDQYLMPRVTKELNESPSRENSGLKWRFSNEIKKSSESNDIIRREWKAGFSWNMLIAIEPGTNSLKISGRVSSYAYMDGYTHSFDIGIGGDWGNHHTEWIHSKGHKDFLSKLAFTGGSKSTGFDLEPELSPIQFTPMHVDKDEIKGGG